MRRPFYTFALIVLFLTGCVNSSNKRADAAESETIFLDNDSILVSEADEISLDSIVLPTIAFKNKNEVTGEVLTHNQFYKLQLNKLPYIYTSDEIDVLETDRFYLERTLISAKNLKLMVIVRCAETSTLRYLVSYNTEGEMIDRMLVQAENTAYHNGRVYSEIKNNEIDVWTKHTDYDDMSNTVRSDTATLIRYSLTPDLMFCDVDVLEMAQGRSKVNIPQIQFTTDWGQKQITKDKLSEDEFRKLHLDKIKGVNPYVDYQKVSQGRNIYVSDKGKIITVLLETGGDLTEYLISYDNQLNIIDYHLIAYGDVVEYLSDVSTVIRKDIMKTESQEISYTSGTVKSSITEFYKITPDLKFDFLKKKEYKTQ